MLNLLVLFLAGLTLAVPSPAASLAQPATADRLRGLLYRIDGEAHVAAQHPEAARDHARAAQRFAHDFEGRLQGTGRRGEGERLTRAADALADAARRREDVDVRENAIAVENEVRRLDGTLPAPELR